jgi:hypothetical protein
MFVRVGLFAIAIILSQGCGKNQCATNSDCTGVSAFCEQTRYECVQCLSDANCLNPGTQFCCRGICQNRADAPTYCGCEASLTGKPGLDCARLAPLGRAAGPKCLLPGDLNPENVKSNPSLGMCSL